VAQSVALRAAGEGSGEVYVSQQLSSSSLANTLLCEGLKGQKSDIIKLYSGSGKGRNGGKGE